VIAARCCSRDVLSETCSSSPSCRRLNGISGLLVWTGPLPGKPISLQGQKKRQDRKAGELPKKVGYYQPTLHPYYPVDTGGLGPMREAVYLCLLPSIAIAPLIAQPHPAPPDRPLTVTQVVRQTSAAVVQVVVLDESGKEFALGSGFLVSADGKIVTNHHVIEGAHSAIAKLANGSFFPVDGVLAADADKDLVLLKVEGKALPFLTLAPTSGLQVGDHVVAIGSPLGLQGTVTDGIVSGFLDETPNKRLIQTNAAVSHGNSGGPLLDMHGKVVGVISSGVSPDEGQNLNFAIPSEEVRRLLSMPLKLASIESIGSAAAKSGEPSSAAANQGGQGHADDQPIPQDRWQAAVAGDPRAQYSIGLSYHYGLHGVDKNNSEAVYWFTKAANQGDAFAEEFLGEAFEYAEGVPRDDVRAADWYRRAADQNLDMAQVALGMMYQEGAGVTQDSGEAAKWLRKAAGQLDIDWAREAAEKGYVEALYFLGLRCYIGEGVPQNYGDSFFWLELVTTATGQERHLAGSHGISDSPVIAKLRSMAASHLDQTEVEQFEERARKWVKEHPTRYE